MPDTGSAFYPAQPLEGRSFKPCPRCQTPKNKKARTRRAFLCERLQLEIVINARVDHATQRVLQRCDDTRDHACLLWHAVEQIAGTH